MEPKDIKLLAKSIDWLTKAVKENTKAIEEQSAAIGQHDESTVFLAESVDFLTNLLGSVVSPGPVVKLPKLGDDCDCPDCQCEVESEK